MDHLNTLNPYILDGRAPGRAPPGLDRGQAEERNDRKAGEFEPWIAPDESYLIFSAQGRPEGPGGFDLYVSERRNGTWQRARPLDPVNSPKGDFNHSVSPDGKYLFVSSTRGQFDSMPPAQIPYPEMQRRLTGIGNGLGDIYRIPMSELEIRVGE